MKTQELYDKKVLILGLGREGLNTLTFLRKLFPKKPLALADKLTIEKLNKPAREEIQKDKNLELYLGKRYLENLSRFDVIIKSPGVPPTLPQLLKIRKAGKTITSQTQLFFENYPGKIIGITGTKGKSTTTTLVYKVLKNGGLDTHLVGNIGKPPLTLLLKAKKEDIFVYELSSHQLYDLTKSPYIAVLLNIFPEHLDYYQSFNQYVRAKANITQFQTSHDYLVFNWSNAIVKKIAQKTQAQKIPFSLTKKLCPGCFVKNKEIVYCFDSKEEKIVSIDKVPLKGKFNLQNVMPAIIIGKLLSIPTPKIAQAIQDFKPLKHRLEKVGVFKGITFYNDSLSTIPQTAIEAIDSFKGEVRTIILGGFERHQDFKNLAKKIWESKIETVILFPTTGERVWAAIRKEKPKNRSLPKHFFVNDMKETVKLAYQHTPKGKICLLSPASASFNLFKDYKERGNLFKKYVRQLGYTAASQRPKTANIIPASQNRATIFGSSQPLYWKNR